MIAMSELSAAAKRVQRFTLLHLLQPSLGGTYPPRLPHALRSLGPEPCFMGDYPYPPMGGTTAPSAYSICPMGCGPALRLRRACCSSILKGRPMASERVSGQPRKRNAN